MIISHNNMRKNLLEALHTLDAKILRPLCATCDKSECEFKARKIPVEPFAFSESQEKNRHSLKCSLELMRQNTVISFMWDKILWCMKVWIESS